MTWAMPLMILKYIPYPPKNKPPSLFDLQVLALVFWPHLYATKMHCQRKRACDWRLTRTSVFRSLDGLSSFFRSFCHTNYGKSIEMSSKSLLMAAVALTISVFTTIAVVGPVGCMTAVLNFSFGGSKWEQTAQIAKWALYIDGEKLALCYNWGGGGLYSRWIIVHIWK